MVRILLSVLEENPKLGSSSLYASGFYPIPAFLTTLTLFFYRLNTLIL
jgi:hypothetical protein